jgi:hypothetical protein
VRHQKCQSPSPFRHSQESRTSNRGCRDFLKARQPPGQHHQSPAQEENLLLREEVQRLHEYRCQNQMRINFLQRQLVAEQQLGHARGLAQATQIQLHGPPADREYSRGCPSGYDYNNDYMRNLRRATDNSRQTFRNFCCGHSSSGAGPLRSGPSSSLSRPHPVGLPPPTNTRGGQQEPPCQACPLPPPDELVMKTRQMAGQTPAASSQLGWHACPYPKV